MLCFIKRNVKFEEYRLYYNSVNRLVSYFHKYYTDTGETLAQLIRKEIREAPKGTTKTIGEYLKSKHDIEIDFDEIKPVDLYSKLTKALDKLKSYEPYEGRINFSLYFDIFNFENYIYKDKLLKYNIISNSNKMLLPDYISSLFAELICNNNLSKEIRRNIEQYLFAIMSNMDYINVANENEIFAEINSYKVKNIYSVIGNVPIMFDTKEKVEIITVRGDCFIDLSKIIIPYLGNKITVSIDDDIATGQIRFKEQCQISLEPHAFDDNKQTFESLDRAFNDNENNTDEYNLIVISSSFHLLKCAIEIEKRFHRKSLKKPNNILLVGQSKIYDIIKTTPDTKSNLKNKKEIKSLVYEIIMHNLDRNAIK